MLNKNVIIKIYADEYEISWDRKLIRKYNSPIRIHK